MRTFQSFVFVFICLIFSTALSATNPIPVPKSDLSNVDVEQFLDMKYRTFKTVTGKKHQLGDRLKFMATKKYLEFQLNRDKISSEDDFTTAASGFSFKWGAFFCGLIFNILGIILVLIFYGSPRKDALLSWLIGFLIAGGALGLFWRR